MFFVCNVRRSFFFSSEVKKYAMWTCLDVCRPLSLLLHNICVSYRDAIYHQFVGIPMGTNRALLIAKEGGL